MTDAFCVRFLMTMKNKTRFITQGAILAAAYVALTHLQNFLLPGSASAAIQVRVSEALSIFAFFTPAAIPGLALGCAIFNLTSGMALPLDFLFGSIATALAATCMWLSRKWTVFGTPVFGLIMPAVFNGLLIGWELSLFIGGGFFVNCGYVALGEIIALMLGLPLYWAMKKAWPKLHKNS